VIAMMLGVALHLQGATVPAAEILVALTILGLGALLLWQRKMPAAAALALFALVGLIHGYALGESIFGAEKTPLAAYLLGLAIIQALIALGAMVIVRAAAKRADLVMPRLIGAGVAGVGLAILVQQIVPGV
jgi:urease accessory protein